MFGVEGKLGQIFLGTPVSMAVMRQISSGLGLIRLYDGLYLEWAGLNRLYDGLYLEWAGLNRPL